MLPDDDGNLWLSSNTGLSKFDPRSVTDAGDTLAEGTFTNYDVDDGLQSNEFMDRRHSFTPAPKALMVPSSRSFCSAGSAPVRTSSRRSSMRSPWV